MTEPTNIHTDFHEAVEDYQRRGAHKVSLYLLKTDAAEYFAVGTTPHRVSIALAEFLLTEKPKKMTLKEMFSRVVKPREDND